MPLKYSRVEIAPALRFLSDPLETESHEPFKETRNFVIDAHVEFVIPAQSAEEARLILEEFVLSTEGKGSPVTVQVTLVKHLADHAEWNEGVC